MNREEIVRSVGEDRGANRRWWALAGISLALLAVGLDATVLSLALPTLAGALHASESELQWFVTAYTLALTAAMLPAGLIGDRFGRRAVLLGALVVFGVASLACAWAPSAIAFIVARAVLGLAGAGMIVMALSVITVLFTEEERPRAIGVWGAANFLSLPIGPILGGWMLSNMWWGWVFLLNIPVVIVGIVAVVALVPESRAATRPHIDWPGIVTSAIDRAFNISLSLDQLRRNASPRRRIPQPVGDREERSLPRDRRIHIAQNLPGFVASAQTAQQPSIGKVASMVKEKTVHDSRLHASTHLATPLAPIF